MKQAPTLLPHIACPSCGGLSAIGHTVKGRAYTWWCSNDDCGKQYRWKQNENGSIDAEPTGVTVRRVSVLLKLDPQEKPLFLIVKGAERAPEDQEYYYNEGTCPTNYLSEIEEVYLDGCPDPHGVFAYITSIDKRENATLEDFKCVLNATA